MSSTTTRRPGSRTRAATEPRPATGRRRAETPPAAPAGTAAAADAKTDAKTGADTGAATAARTVAVKAAKIKTAKPSKAAKPARAAKPSKGGKSVQARIAGHDRNPRPGTNQASGTRTASRPDSGATRRRATAVRTPGGRTAAAVQARAHARAPRAPFVLLVIGLLGGALVSLLLLNTVLAEDSFALDELKRNNKLLDQQRQALQEEIAREESPDRLAQKARSLGMTQPSRPSFIDMGNGRVVGDTATRPVPYAAAASAGATGVVGVPGVVVPFDRLPGWTAAAGGAGQAEGAR